jgi:hypothetical protein
VARLFSRLLHLIAIASLSVLAETFLFAQSVPNGEGDAVLVSLGRATLPLYGPWKFHIGDSPIDPKTGKPLWVEPEFDDSKWETVDLAPEAGASDRNSEFAGYVPGWTARGHAGYWGYAWYRIHIRVEARAGEKLALEGPADVDDAYQLFDNGRMVGSFGDFSGKNPAIYDTQPMLFPLTQAGDPGFGDNPGSFIQVLAFRLWMEPNTLTNTPDAGGIHTAPVLGETGATTADYRIRRLEIIGGFASNLVEALLFGLLAVVAFSLILFDRSDPVYPWMGSLFLLVAARNVLSVLDGWTQRLSIFDYRLLNDGVLYPLMYAGWAIVWWVWFGRQRPAWLPRAVAALTLLYMVSNVVGEELFFAFVPHPVAAVFLNVSIVVRLLFFALLAWIVLQGIRRQGIEGWLVLPAVVLWGIGAFVTELIVLRIHVVWHPFGTEVGLAQVASVLLVAVMALLLLRRLLQSVRRQRELALDVKQAQEVQQVLLPEAHLALPGLIVESEYRPAREVGGDFFQMISNQTKNSLLIVAGDVTGKGLKAGMLVALLVGAIRSTAEFNSEPEFILSALNRRLLGRGDAQATCLALRIEGIRLAKYTVDAARRG